MTKMDQNLIEMNHKIDITTNSHTPNNHHHITIKDNHVTVTELSWNQLSVWSKPVRSCFRLTRPPIRILDSISGSVESGQLLAVMGPSGSGKTTFLNTLTGRNLSSFNCEGTVLINKHRADLKTIKSLSGYVQQGDMFVPMLTVREHLIFMSLVRMDRNCGEAKRMQRIDEILEELELTKCANVRIGNRYDDIVGSGISGGESRRLSFATEMLTNPMVLFCDEPTSGLDSHLAESVVNILKKMAQSGRIIICTIHQPSSQVFILFDKLLLLTQGKVAFMGTPDSANRFFSSLNFHCPPNFNPADFYLKQLSVVPGYKEECLDRIDKICQSFQNECPDQPTTDQTETITSSTESLTDQAHQIIYKASWLEQFNALLWRSFISSTREPNIVRIKITQTLTVALLLGIVYWGQKLDQKGIMNINGAIFILIINLTFMNVFSVIHTFCSELPLFLREYNNGMYRVDTYFLAKMFSEFPHQIIIPTMFVSILYYMVGFQNTLHSFIMFILISDLVANCGTSFGYMISCLSSNTKIAVALSSPLILPLLLFGGFFINNSTIPAVFKIFKYASWFYYGNEALILIQWTGINNITCDYDSTLNISTTINPLMSTTTTTMNSIMTSTIAPTTTQQITLQNSEQRCLTKGQSVIEELSFDPNNLYLDIIALISLIIIMRLVAFFSLSNKARKR